MEGDCYKRLKLMPPQVISIHALRVEGDDGYFDRWGYKCNISIHALRVEGDQDTSVSVSGNWRISIHALRVEGDVKHDYSTA